MFSSFLSHTKEYIAVAKKTAQAGTEIMAKAGGEMNKHVLAGAEAIGLKDQLESVEKAVGRVGKDAKGARNRAVNQARRFANRALDFNEDDDSLDSSDYDLLLSAAGASEKVVGIHHVFTQSFQVPVGAAFVWKARVKKYDIGFCIKEIRDGKEDIEIESMQRVRSDALTSGQLAPGNYSRSFTIVFDNSTSLQPKRVALWVAIGENVSLADDSVGAARSKEVKAAEEGPRDD